MKGTDRYRVAGVSCSYGDRVLLVANLSVGGFFVETTDSPGKGSVIKLTLSLPGAPPPIPMVGTVAWVNGRDRLRSPTLPPGFGFKVKQIGFREKMAILAYLRRYQPTTTRDR